MTDPTGSQAQEIDAACQRLSLAFALHADAHRFAELGQLFTEDGALRRANGDVVVGPAAITRSFDGRPASFHSVHILAPVLVEIVSADEATGRCAMLVVVHESGSGSPRRMAGFYDDRYRRIGGTWKFAARLSTIAIPNA
ncbi:MAG: hypothetical protein JWM77_823 [Rhodospirillales bacterium]|nr:hypothetical protein [Rhodospirillales bacterium]